MIDRRSYFDRPGVSQSQLRDFARSPLHYHAIHVAKTAPREETPAMRLGTALHAAVLEPYVFARDYTVKDWDGRTKEGKLRAAEVESRGLVVLSEDDETAVCGMAQAIHEHPLAARVLAARTHTEHQIFWECPTTGVACKGKPDACVELGGRRSLVDLKSTTDASPEAFAKSIANFWYHVQASHYLDGWRAAVGPVESFTFIVVENSAPFAVAVYELDAESIAAGDRKRLELLDRMATCQAENRWPGYEAQTIELPRWAM